jgi:hypothetical protein
LINFEGVSEKACKINIKQTKSTNKEGPKMSSKFPGCVLVSQEGEQAGFATIT